ncbi:MAG TPA: MMPL family transporter, partial [Actinomycetales bacterium]|nr:MMPL family transporter [Actinomycetales bacterium]
LADTPGVKAVSPAVPTENPAGAIMIVVFGAFMLSPDRLLQQTGFGMAVAIFVDAVIIRCLIVPAAMQLMGRRAWWMPEPLARLLPKVELEKR